MRYCFGPLIQRELTEFATWWNNYAIRVSTFGESPGGKPEILYHMPHILGASDHICSVNSDLLVEIETDVCHQPKLCNTYFQEFAAQVLRDLSISQPQDPHEASHLFFVLTNIVETL